MKGKERFSCALIGESNLLVRCAEILEARGHRIAAIVTKDKAVPSGGNVFPSLAEAKRSLAERPDFLFSVVNRAVLTPEELGWAALASINYHDSLLPAYAGVNAPSWAILHGESEHGVTWHLMSHTVDAGDILVQRRFPVADEETALSLSAKCFEHAAESFGELLDKLEAGNLRGAHQDPAKRSVFPKARRLPRQGIIRWTDTAEEISRFVRSAQLGPYANDFGLAKILLSDSTVVIVGRVGLLPDRTTKKAGTILDVGRHALHVATGDGAVIRLEDLTLSDGRSFAVPSEMKDAVLLVLAQGEEQVVESASVAAAKQEEDLGSMLASLAPPLRIEGLRPCKYAETGEHVFEFPADRPSTPGEVFAPILSRLAQRNQMRPFTVAIAQRVPPAFMTRRPFVCRDADIATLAKAIDGVLASPPIPADLPSRFPELRAAHLRIDSISVCLSAEEAPPKQNSGLIVWLNNGHLSLRFAASQLRRDEAQKIAEILMGQESTAETKAGGSFRSIHQWIADRAAATPEAIAIEDGERKVSYALLCRHANQLAAALFEHGAAIETLYAVLLPQGAEFVTAMLGVLQSGAAYLPLEPSMPLHRLREIVRDARPAGVITDAAHAELAGQLGADVIRLDALSGTPLRLVKPATHPDDLAYVIYTSGSTGEPKGSMIEHGALAGFIADDITRNEIGPSDRVLQLCSPAFDASVEESFSALCAGATLVIRPADLLDSADAFLDFCEESRLSIIGIYASMLGDVLAVMEQRGRFPATVRLATTGGEMVSATGALRWRSFFNSRALSAPKFLNVYGLTETTVANCSSDLSQEPDLPGQVPIGRPFPGNLIKVVNRNLAEVAPGEIGELLIAGPQLARAYWNRPEINAARFFHDSCDGTRWFRTGDLVRLSPAGQLYFDGRIDRQVKVNGVRIELEDIERAMQSHPEVAHAAAILHRLPGGGDILAGCFSPAKDGLEANLRRHLEERLPVAMRPRLLVPLGEFPLNDRGKTDQAALSRHLDRHVSACSTESAHSEDAAARVWREFFPWSEVDDPEETFFNLGGDSLTAVRLLFRAEQETGVRLPVSSFFREPNLGGLRRMLAAGKSDPTFDPLLTLQPKGEGTPIYILHGGDGDVAGYSAILNHLGKERPVYGVRSAAVLHGEGLPDSFEQAASEVVAVITKHRPQGNWILFGYSWGGTLAYETAVQLHAKTGLMPEVIMLDALAPLQDITGIERAVHFARRYPRWVMRSWLGTRIVRLTRNCLLQLSPKTRASLRQRTTTALSRIPSSFADSWLGSRIVRNANDFANHVAHPRRVAAPSGAIDPTEHHFQLARVYRPSHLRGLAIHLIRASRHEISPFHRDVQFGWKDNGWGKTTGCVVRSHEIRNCNHNELLREPKCRDVAEWIRKISANFDRERPFPA